MKKIFWLALVFLLLIQARVDADDVILASFKNQGFTYGFAGWQNLAVIQSTSDTSVNLHGTSAGGVGLILDRLQDVSDTMYLIVKLRKGLISNEDGLNIKLIDADGRWSQWSIKSGDIPQNTVGDVKLLLSKPDSTDGKGAGLDELKQFQIQGTFNSSNAVDVEIESLIASGSNTTAAPAAH